MTPHERTLALEAYCRGKLSRDQVMQVLGIDWYGDLLRLVTSAGLMVQPPGPDDLALMDKSVTDVFGWVESGSKG